MKILLADDDEPFRKSVKMFLENSGHEVVEVENGNTAARKLDVEKIKFDAVITDMQMPMMSGWDVLMVILMEDIKVPALLHSAETYVQGQNLEETPKTFDFARFHLKDGLNYIKDFLKDVESKQKNKFLGLG